MSTEQNLPSTAIPEQLAQLRGSVRRIEETAKADAYAVYREHMEHVDDLAAQLEAAAAKSPRDRWICVDLDGKTIALQGEREPFMEKDPFLVLAFAVLRDAHREAADRGLRPEPMKADALFPAMAERKRQLFGVVEDAEVRTLQRRLQRALRQLETTHPVLRGCFCSEGRPYGGYFLDLRLPVE